MPTAKLKEKFLDAEWKAQLDLKFSKSNNRTILSHRKHFGPLQVQKPFYPEINGTCHVYILHPPGGVVGGDRLNIYVDVSSNAHALVTTPAAGKFYRSAGPVARQEQIIKIASKGILEWFPSENIIFSGAKAKIQTKVKLAHDSHFVLRIVIGFFQKLPSQLGIELIGSCVAFARPDNTRPDDVATACGVATVEEFHHLSAVDRMYHRLPDFFLL